MPILGAKVEGEAEAVATKEPGGGVDGGGGGWGGDPAEEDRELEEEDERHVENGSGQKALHGSLPYKRQRRLQLRRSPHRRPPHHPLPKPGSGMEGTEKPSSLGLAPRLMRATIGGATEADDGGGGRDREVRGGGAVGAVERERRKVGRLRGRSVGR